MRKIPKCWTSLKAVLVSTQSLLQVHQQLPACYYSKLTFASDVGSGKPDRSKRKKKSSNQKSSLSEVDSSQVTDATRSEPKGSQFWMINMHKRLMESVYLPPVKKSYPRYSEDFLQSLSTLDLMSQARNIQHVDKETMKVITALWRRLDSMTMEEMITVADIFYMNQVPNPWYTTALISYITEMFDLLYMTPHQLTRFTMHVACHAHSPPYLQIALEQRLAETLDEFNINQVCVCCHLFFFGRTRIKSATLLDRIGQKLLDEFDTVKNWYLPMIMKTFRLSNYVKVSFYKSLGDLIVKTDYFSQYRTVGQMMHFAFAFASVRVTHPDLFLYLLRQCLRPQFKRRFKDIPKIIWACGTLVTNDREHLNLVHMILKKTRFQKEDMQRYPDNLADLLMGLAFLGIYPPTLLDWLFEPSMVKALTGLKKEREKFLQLQFLDNSLRIECPKYTGNRLSEAYRDVVSAKLSKFRPEIDTQLRKSINPAVSALRDAVGSECVACDFILPHVKSADILLCFDRETREFIPPATVQWDGKNSPGLSNSRDKEKLQHIVIVLLSRPQTSFDGKLLGLVHTKLRQLRCLGFKVITIPAEEALLYTIQDRMSTQQALMSHVQEVIQTV
ncbi:FAST kinase domain-containing protein 5, mitochondrial [Aplysia californica]|uniref:FAST kinase domain-containing protein 5, mitochondrial n=1 Tax=Aplysia californica TaxID=6500 RepID=A0ABM1A3R0_APLCA|nr:FAST kinase domain-containing protein 5, mitochondrial [Aplysia californica]